MVEGRCLIAAHGPWVEQLEDVELIAGWAQVLLRAAFLAHADVSRYQVSLTSYDPVVLFVQNRTERSFEIHALAIRRGRGPSSVGCGCRVLAPRRGFSRATP